MLKITKISNYSEFKRHKEAWEDLLSRSKIDNVFLTHEWIGAYIKHFCKDKELLLLNIFEDKQLIGIVPLMIDKRRYFGLPVRVVCFIGTMVSDRMDFILNGNRKIMITLILDYLMRMKTKWDFIDFQEIAAYTDTAEVIKKWLHREKIANIIDPLKKSFLVEFNGNSSSLLEKFSDRFYKKARKIYNKWSGLDFKFERYFRKDFKTEETFFCIDKLEEKSWKGERKVGLFSNQDSRNFYREIFGKFSKNNWVDLSILNIDKKPIAYIFNYCYNKRLYNYNMAFDRRYSCLSPGTLLMFWTLKDSTAKNISEFDFGRGEEAWKERITKDFVTHARIRIFKNTFYSVFLYWIQSKIAPYGKKIKMLARNLWKQ